MNVATKLLEGRPHYVVPVTMIREGVWAGSQGPVSYPADVLKATAHVWNGKPIVVYHPSMAGQGFAGHPEVFDKQRVGTIFNSRFEGGKLKADAWLDVSRLDTVDVRIANAIKKGQPVEVSTGVGVNHSGVRNAAGAFEAEALHPDHLAILPTGRGACSIKDGAGLMMNTAGHFEQPLMIPAVV